MNTMLSTKPISEAIGEIRIHPEDYRELCEIFRFCWPRNSSREVFSGVRLIADVTAERLSRVAL